MPDLCDEAKAYYMFLRGYPNETIALASGVSERTVRSWDNKNGWKGDRDQVLSMVKAIVLRDVIADYLRDDLMTKLKDKRSITMTDLNRRDP